MFIEQAYKAKNTGFLWYLLGSFIVGVAATIGQVPWTLAVLFKAGPSVLTNPDQSALMQVLDSNLNLFLLLLTFVFGAAAFYFVIRLIHRQKLMEVTTTRKKLDWGRVFFSFGLLAVFSIGSLFIDYLMSPEDYVLNFKLGPFLILCVIAIVMLPIQTSLEEYLFRGYLMQGFGLLAKNRWFPLMMTSLIFGGLHMANPEVAKLGYILSISYIGIALLLGIMTLMDEGMELALGFHAANNMIIALLVTTDWSALQSNAVLKNIAEPEVGIEVFFPLLVVYPIFLTILAYRYKWTGWREKLFGRIDPPPPPAPEPLEEYRVAD